MEAAKHIPMYPVTENKEPVVKEIQENYATGYISLFRSIREHWVWNDPNKFQWWVDILMECNHADKKVPIGFELLDCKRGQSLHSLLEWSKRWRVDISTVRRFFTMLENDAMIVKESLSKTTRITVCKYDSYQNVRHDKQSQNKGKANAAQSQDNTNNNANNYNNDNNSGVPPTEPQKTFKQWTAIEFKKDISDNKEIIEGGKDHVQAVCAAFYNYWVEKDAKSRMRFQLERTWETRRRMFTWINNNFKKQNFV